MNLFRKISLMLRKRRIPEKQLLELKEQSFQFKDEKLEAQATYSGPILKEFINEIAYEWSKCEGAVNYMQFTAFHEKMGIFEITIRPQHGKLMGTINAEQKRRIAELEDALCWCYINKFEGDKIHLIVDRAFGGIPHDRCRELDGATVMGASKDTSTKGHWKK